MVKTLDTFAIGETGIVKSVSGEGKDFYGNVFIVTLAIQIFSNGLYSKTS